MKKFLPTSHKEGWGRTPLNIFFSIEKEAKEAVCDYIPQTWNLLHNHCDSEKIKNQLIQRLYNSNQQLSQCKSMPKSSIMRFEDSITCLQTPSKTATNTLSAYKSRVTLWLWYLKKHLLLYMPWIMHGTWMSHQLRTASKKRIGFCQALHPTFNISPTTLHACCNWLVVKVHEYCLDGMLPIWTD